jgi:hypothetical protein
MKKRVFFHLCVLLPFPGPDTPFYKKIKIVMTKDIPNHGVTLTIAYYMDQQKNYSRETEVFDGVVEYE